MREVIIPSSGAWGSQKESKKGQEGSGGQSAGSKKHSSCSALHEGGYKVGVFRRGRITSVDRGGTQEQSKVREGIPKGETTDGAWWSEEEHFNN